MEKYLPLIIGFVLIILNKPFYQGLNWWERDVLLLKHQINQWVYRIWIIFIGLFFISIYFLKEY